MRKAIVILALTSPLCAQAVPVYVDYEGSIASVTRTVCRCDGSLGTAPPGDLEFTNYSVGDLVKGRLTIDLDRAPPDYWPGEPNLGSYSSTMTGAVDFVSGNGPTSTRLTLKDVVSVMDRRDGQFQTYTVEDRWSTPHGVGGLNLGFISERDDLISGDSMRQSFDVVPDEQTRLTGHIHKLLENGRSWVSVVATLDLNRLTVTPGSCHP